MNETKTSCLDCEHFHFEDWGTCDAFPNGIPTEITFGVVNHFEPYEGDNGIQFKHRDSK